MKHISGIIKRVREGITVEDKTLTDAERKKRQRQWDEAMKEQAAESRWLDYHEDVWTDPGW